ncbi:hypothetical protein BV22DRAFT_120804 [Leucogyrophana mollusca]|uniref:Uncharacterized protein n=1 Tax=Leucogyrophana mollusca TaxID=85980 RepID=A0ACB8BY12_9AGAM|nr:hypothetical protein BV22DRAFT_120804 [Leucogyrophana mollusca]
MASAASTAMSTAVTTTPSLGSSSSSAATTMSCKGGDHVYKGKITNRSWQQLPPELVRLIATHYLYDVTSSNYCPNTWDAKELWHPRMVYTALRDANELEKLMRTTPTWFTALETHLFWQQACAVLDPHDVLTHHLIVRPPPPAAGGAGGAAAVFQAYRVTPFRHFRNMTQSSCAVCRINCPYSSVGLAVAKRSHPTPTLGMISLCREHRKTMFCGLCLREAPPAECDPHFGLHANNLTGYNQPYNPAANFGLGMGGYNAYSGTQTATAMVCCAENEDDETWPGIETTCRSCRSEWLWRRVSSSSRDREAIAGPRYAQLPPPAQSRGSQRTTNPSSTKTRHFPPSQPPPTKYASADWETRQTVDAFIELGEGSIAEVISIAREKLWLRSQTKMAELMEQAVAATRWAGEGMGVDFAPVNPIQNNTQSSGGNQVVHSEKAPQQVHNEGDAVYSPANSLSPSPPSPRSGQRSRSRSPSPRSAYSSEYEGSEEEDDPELLSLTEDAGGVRELAISDWARARIIDGHWCSPADQWYGFARPLGGGVRDPGNDTDSESDLDEDETSTDGARRHRRVHATHPCPWTLSSPSSPQNPSSPSSASDDEHPRLMTVRAHAPPSFTLCEQAYRAYQKQLKLILLPAMNNLVRRLVIESQTGGGDPAVRAARMEPEEVLAELRTPGVWFDGFDWAASAGGKKEDDTASSTSASTRSDVSHTTSPVLSTTTLQTTPSPPPGRDEDKEKGRVNSGARPLSVAIPIPVSPVLESPKLLHPIPYVPVTLAQMPQYSLEAFKLVCTRTPLSVR